MRYRFTGGDGRQYFALGDVAPGDEHDFDDGPPDDGCWEPADGLSAPLAAEPGPLPTAPPTGPAGPAEKD